MAESKAVIAHLRADFTEHLLGCPVVDATPQSLTEVLRALVRDPERRAMLGAAGKRYVQQRHDLPVVGERLLREYRRVLDAGKPEAIPLGVPVTGTRTA
jgi:glycosyltransferase involved in cell wall biosynthesis